MLRDVRVDHPLSILITRATILLVYSIYPRPSSLKRSHHFRSNEVHDLYVPATPQKQAATERTSGF